MLFIQRAFLYDSHPLGFSLSSWTPGPHVGVIPSLFTGVELILRSKLFCFEICTPEGRGGEKGGNANFKMKHTKNFDPRIYSTHVLGNKFYILRSSRVQYMTLRYPLGSLFW